VVGRNFVDRYDPEVTVEYTDVTGHHVKRRPVST
jgi:hypothetical protein